MNVDVEVVPEALTAIGELLDGDPEQNCERILEAGARLTLILAVEGPVSSPTDWDNLLIRCLMEAGLDAGEVETFTSRYFRITKRKARNRVENALARYRTELAAARKTAVQRLLEDAKPYQAGWRLQIRSAFVEDSIMEALDGTGLPAPTRTTSMGVLSAADETYQALRKAFGLAERPGKKPPGEK